MPNLVALGQTVLAYVGVPKIWERLGPPLKMGLSDSLKTRSPHKCYHGEFRRSRSNGWCAITEILAKLHPAFQGHSRSLELTGIDRLPMTSL